MHAGIPPSPRSRPPGPGTPQPGIPPDQAPPRADTPLGLGTPPRQMATVADGAHPTGMHSCWHFCLTSNENKLEIFPNQIDLNTHLNTSRAY